MNVELLTDHELFGLLKEQDADAWRYVYVRAVLAESRCFRSSEVARKWGVSSDELMSLLYEEMIGRGKINLYRDDGGSLIGWLRRYVHGYVSRANPAARREISLDTAGTDDFGSENAGGVTFEEKISKKVSDARAGSSLPDEDPAVQRREEWAQVQTCFGELWKKNPMRAYVHLLKLRLNLSSTQIKDMLGISSEANVDQTFSRAVRTMRELKVQHA